MRRLPLLIILALVVATPAVAATRSEHHFSMSFSKKTPATSTGISFVTDRFSYVAPPVGQKADRVAKIVFTMAPGTKTDTRATAVCSKAQLEQGGLTACPAGAKVGTGTATAITGLVDLDPVSFQVTVLAKRYGLLAFLAGGGVTQIVELSMSGNKITTEVPRICSPGGALENDCANGDTVLKQMSVKIAPHKRGKHMLVRTPKRCPKAGVWTNTATYTFVNGDTETEKSTTPCRK
jgi:hypothetical protein